jgi:hypothetical protein
MFRFTIRDVLWLMVVVGLAIVWLMDRNAMRRERAESARREAELTSRAKMWENEASRAEKRYSDVYERLSGLEWSLRMRDIKLSDLVDANYRPKSPPPPRKSAPVSQ